MLIVIFKTCYVRLILYFFCKFKNRLKNTILRQYKSKYHSHLLMSNLIKPTFIDNVSYSNYDTSNIIANPPEKKTVKKGAGKDITFDFIPFKYNYGTAELKRPLEFKLDCPKLTAKTGIRSKQGEENPEELSYNLISSYDTGNPDHKALIDCFEQIVEAAIYIVDGHKVALGRHKYNADSLRILMKGLVFEPTDKVSGTPTGQPPMSVFKLFKTASNQTKFYGPDGNVIPWTYLTKVQFDYYPLLKIKGIFNNSGHLLIQTVVEQALVTDIKDIGGEISYTDSYAKVQAEQPGLSDAVNAQLAKIMASRQDSVNSEKKEVKEEQKVEDSPVKSVYDVMTDQVTTGTIPPMNAPNTARAGLDSLTSNPPSRIIIPKPKQTA